MPATALERLIIGMHLGQFDCTRMAQDLQKSFHPLRNIQPDDVAAIYEHQKKIQSHAWEQYARGGLDPAVKRVLAAITENEKKQKMDKSAKVEKVDKGMNVWEASDCKIEY